MAQGQKIIPNHWLREEVIVRRYACLPCTGNIAIPWWMAAPITSPQWRLRKTSLKGTTWEAGNGPKVLRGAVSVRTAGMNRAVLQRYPVMSWSVRGAVRRWRIS